MKKLAIAMMLGVSALTASAQVNYKVQTACHPQDVKHYDTERLRNSFMMEKVMAPDEINVTYTLYDRLIYGGAMPVNKVLKLETFRELGPEITYFLERRELGVINIGGDGVVTVDGKEYPMKYKEALYVGCGNKEVTFKSNDATKPAKFYINSAPAYKPYVTQLMSFISSFFKASVPVIPNANLSSEHGIFLPDNSFIVSCKECNTAYSVSIRVPSMSKTICLYFMLPPFPACIKITYYPAWISYCNTIRRDRAGNYTSSPYHAVFPYSAQQLPKNRSAFFYISIIRKIIFPC